MIFIFIKNEFEWIINTNDSSGNIWMDVDVKRRLINAWVDYSVQIDADHESHSCSFKHYWLCYGPKQNISKIQNQYKPRESQL